MQLARLGNDPLLMRKADRNRLEIAVNSPDPHTPKRKLRLLLIVLATLSL